MTIDPTPELARWGTVARQYLTECTEMPHTPGPWTYSPNYGRIGTPAGTIAVLQVGDGRAGVGIPADEQRANGRLMWAAPDLLEACELAVEWAKDAPVPYRDWPFIRAARAAIAKAKGE